MPDRKKIAEFEADWGTGAPTMGAFLATLDETLEILRYVARFVRQARNEFRTLTDLSITLGALTEDLKRLQRQTRNELRDHTAILNRIADAVESIDTKTKDKGK